MIVRGFVPSARPAMLSTFLGSWSACETTSPIPLTIACHGHPWEEFERAIEPHEGVLDIRVSGHFTTYQPVYPERVRMMVEYPEVDVYIALDDDIECLPGLTDFTLAIAKSQECGVGCVSTGWARSPVLVEKAKRSMDRPWVKQALVNTGGGMVYGRHVLREMQKRVKSYLYDDIQTSLAAYVGGYENWRYRGSIVIHRSLSAGGVKEVFRSYPLELPNPDYIRLEPVTAIYRGAAARNNVAMPSPSNLSGLAHEHHARNREEVMARCRVST